MAFWFQPLLLSRTGLPLASLALMLFVVLVVVRATARGVSLPVMRGAASIAYVGLFWAGVTAVTGSALGNLLVWLTLLGAILAGPLLSVLGQSSARTVAYRSALISLTISTCAIVLERYVSPTLFGLITVPQSVTRLPGLGTNPNGSALYVMVGMILVWRLGGGGTSPIGTAARICLLSGGAWSLLQLGSRGAFLGVVCAALVDLIVRRGHEMGRTIPRRFAAAALTGLLLSFLFDIWRPDILASVFQSGRLDAPDDRVGIWDAASRLIREHPVFGSSAFNVNGLEVNNAHNSVLEAAIRYGIPGAVCLVMVIVALIRPLCSPVARSDVGSAALLVIVGASVYSFFHTGMLDNTYVWLLITSLSYSALNGNPVHCWDRPRLPPTTLRK